MKGPSSGGKFPLTSDQLELLLAFESTESLEKLAAQIGRDPSVISRNLRRLADESPVLAKVRGRWHITPLGRRVNAMSREYLARLVALTRTGSAKGSAIPGPLMPANTPLIVINAQKALHDPAQGRRSNACAEANIARVLEAWRKRRRPVIHIRHVSENPRSFFHKDCGGAAFIPALGPRASERVMEKTKASAFVGTGLERILSELQPDAIALVGFTAAECIDATARQASDLGFRVFVVGDATATFELIGPKGQLHKAEKAHRSTLATLHALFAQVVETDEAIR